MKATSPNELTSAAPPSFVVCAAFILLRVITTRPFSSTLASFYQ